MATRTITTPITIDHDHHHHHRDPLASRIRRGCATTAGIAPCSGALVCRSALLSLALGVLWAGVIGVIAIALGMAITLAAIGMASMVAHRMIIGDGRSREIGPARLRSAASLIVIATAGTLLLGAVESLIR